MGFKVRKKPTPTLSEDLAELRDSAEVQLVHKRRTVDARIPRPTLPSPDMAIGCELIRDREPLQRALSSLPLLREPAPARSIRQTESREAA